MPHSFETVEYYGRGPVENYIDLGDTRHAAFAEDAFKYLDRMGDQYDLIILDPP